MIEEMFDKAFNWEILINDWYQTLPITDDIKTFLFETIIPEVLKSIIEDNSNTANIYWEVQSIEQNKQKAKELYWIDL